MIEHDKTWTISKRYEQIGHVSAPDLARPTLGILIWETWIVMMMKRCRVERKHHVQPQECRGVLKSCVRHVLAMMNIANLPFADVSLFKQSGLSFIEPWIHKRKLHQCYNRHWRLWHASSNHSGGWWTGRTELVVWASHRCWKYASLLAIYAKHCRCFKGVGVVTLFQEIQRNLWTLTRTRHRKIMEHGLTVDMLGPSNGRSGQC